jgi:dipeptide/tripeptide permease
MCSDVGAIIGPLAAGLLADKVSYGVAFGVGAGLLLAGAGAALRMPRKQGNRRTEELDGSTTAR